MLRAKSPLHPSKRLLVQRNRLIKPPSTPIGAGEVAAADQGIRVHSTQHTHTISQGNVVWADGKLDAKRGAGRHIPRPTFSPVFDAVRRQTELKAPRAVPRVAAE